ncbi:hypothetical protein [Enterococcus wangshanyuanii]|uniref:Uncharacterized protein n=1 Tax=Enterococcus wangshanyuanii TaxID=2005703 RepID=A0ABQ1NZC7_9ENTE|nr:hypothetical protein [Enterococcus wangshanyuanii]GGC88158.1 hypothetical protein GCM10011573_17200 [Enterococcus wangshanyuanii]
MKYFIVILTFYDQGDQLRSTPMMIESKGKHSAVTICKQQAWERYRLLDEDIVDIHVIPNIRKQKDSAA